MRKEWFKRSKTTKRLKRIGVLLLWTKSTLNSSLENHKRDAEKREWRDGRLGAFHVHSSSQIIDAPSPRYRRALRANRRSIVSTSCGASTYTKCKIQNHKGRKKNYMWYSSFEMWRGMGMWVEWQFSAMSLHQTFKYSNKFTSDFQLKSTFVGFFFFKKGLLFSSSKLKKKAIKFVFLYTWVKKTIKIKGWFWLLSPGLSYESFCFPLYDNWAIGCGAREGEIGEWKTRIMVTHS